MKKATGGDLTMSTTSLRQILNAVENVSVPGFIGIEASVNDDEIDGLLEDMSTTLDSLLMSYQAEDSRTLPREFRQFMGRKRYTDSFPH